MDLPNNGTFQLGSTPVYFSQITDGMSYTGLVGEKHVPSNMFGVGWLDCSLYNGDYLACSARSGGEGIGLASLRTDPEWKFGSYHPGICQFVMADGGVRSLRTTISPDVL